MKRNLRTAYNQLNKIGCPTIEGGYYGEDSFRISAESGDEHHTWADYYMMTDGDCTGYILGVSNRINDILDANGLFAEWINPGVLAVCEV
jgi:hypothetical protein